MEMWTARITCSVGAWTQGSGHYLDRAISIDILTVAKSQVGHSERVASLVLVKCSNGLIRARVFGGQAKPNSVIWKSEKEPLFFTGFLQIPKTAAVLLEFFIKRESKVSLLRDPLSHFCQEEVVLHAQECLLKLNKQVITYQDVRDMVENLVGLHNMVNYFSYSSN